MDVVAVQRFYAGLLTRLFETIAMVIDRQEAMVETTYGPGRMLRVIQRLQREAEIQSSIILDAFSEKRQLQRKVNIRLTLCCQRRMFTRMWRFSYMTSTSSKREDRRELRSRRLPWILANWI